MHLLLTNDDGIHAPGLLALENAALAMGATCTVVAPAVEQSQCGHRVTTHTPLKVTEISKGQYAVHGTPADCVRIALFGLSLKPDAVLSGVNQGGNMGQDIAISGTVAAVREAAYHGLKAMAFSHYIIGGVGFDWPRVSEWTTGILRRLLTESLEDAEYWNVNFPHLPPGPRELPKMLVTNPARSPLKVAFNSIREGDHFLYD
ncbi:MAG: 5-nucleotidase, partial [Verrucomicrobiaceae bacterium]|nr:5-nucleotidase [Verrucomicrobiaceae bacterium]